MKYDNYMQTCVLIKFIDALCLFKALKGRTMRFTLNVCVYKFICLRFQCK